MAFNIEFHAKYILNLWSIFFDPAKVSLKGFAILSKILSTHCEEKIKFTELPKNDYKRFIILYQAQEMNRQFEEKLKSREAEIFRLREETRSRQKGSKTFHRKIIHLQIVQYHFCPSKLPNTIYLNLHLIKLTTTQCITKVLKIFETGVVVILWFW